ncbi:hypothetical protein ACIPPQ_17000 [Sphingopyxis sp. LARHCG72]
MVVVRQTRRARPTFDTAHQYHREGVYLKGGPDVWVDVDERHKIVDAVTSELDEIVKKHFPRSPNLEYAILKAHLIVERSIEQYIRCLSNVLVELKGLRKFNFSQKIEFAYLLGMGANDPVLLPTIERLNVVRNQVAHTFEIDRKQIDEMLRINSDDYDNFTITDDRQRVRMLRMMCSFISGRLIGEVQARIFFDAIVLNSLNENGIAT